MYHVYTYTSVARHKTVATPTFNIHEYISGAAGGTGIWRNVIQIYVQ